MYIDFVGQCNDGMDLFCIMLKVVCCAKVLFRQKSIYIQRGVSHELWVIEYSNSKKKENRFAYHPEMAP